VRLDEIIMCLLSSCIPKRRCDCSIGVISCVIVSVGIIVDVIIVIHTSSISVHVDVVFNTAGCVRCIWLCGGVHRLVVEGGTSIVFVGVLQDNTL